MGRPFGNLIKASTLIREHGGVKPVEGFPGGGDLSEEIEDIVVREDWGVT